VVVREEGGTVWIRGYRTGKGYRIEVEDNGVGFDVDKIEEKMDIGLNYIREQIKEMPGANMSIESVLGQGTKVWIDFEVMINESYSG
jgi:signal transduction histidine kinase